MCWDWQHQHNQIYVAKCLIFEFKPKRKSFNVMDDPSSLLIKFKPTLLTLQMLRARVEGRFGIRPPKQILMHKGQVLSKRGLLYDLGVRRGSLILVHERGSPSWGVKQACAQVLPEMSISRSTNQRISISEAFSVSSTIVKERLRAPVVSMLLGQGGE